MWGRAMGQAKNDHCFVFAKINLNHFWLGPYLFCTYEIENYDLKISWLCVRHPVVIDNQTTGNLKHKMF